VKVSVVALFPPAKMENVMQNQYKFVTALAAVCVVMAGCATAPETPVARENLQDDAQVAVRRFDRADSTLQSFLDRAPGYVIFPSVGKGGFIAGGAYGKGVLYQHGTPIGYADMTEATFGLQAGGQDFAELIVFQDDASIIQFKTSGGYGLSAEASGVVVKPGAAAQAQFKEGVAVFTLVNGGLMGEIAVAGQKFRFRSLEEVSDSDRARSETTTTTATGTAPSNISAGASVSTPNGGDASVSGKANVTASGSASTPNGDTTGTTVKTTTVTTPAK